MIERSVLIIDDEKRMTDSLRDLFAAGKYRVETANSGAEGIAALERRSFPVVVTDLRMQGIDGLHVIRYVHEHFPKTLVIVITGYASTESAIEALHYQAFDYIRKPFEFDHLKSALDRAFHKLEVDQLREDTAAMITHDIKVPLTSIMGFAGLLQNPETGAFHPRAGEFTEMIRSNAQKILALVDNYLTTCKIDSDTLLVHPRPMRLGEMIQDLLDRLHGEAARGGFEFVFDREGMPETALLDEPYIFRAVGNLLQNAIKYGDPADPVRISAPELPASDSPLGKPTLRISVVNRAPGVTPASLEGLFGRFRRACDDSGIEGSGIGLYVVDAVARAHGGRPEARCLEGGRVSFSMLIPLAEQGGLG